MENEKELETYIKDSEHRLIISNNIDEIQKLKEEVNNKYIDLYNNKSASDAELIGLTELKSKIEEKEMEIQKENFLDKDLELIEGYTNLLNDINEFNEILDKE